MIEGRYRIFGVVPSEHDEGNPGLDPEAQRVGSTVELYGTDDKEEAKKIINEGGFLRDVRGKEIWCAATWAQDTNTGGTIGDAPESAKNVGNV